MKWLVYHWIRWRYGKVAELPPPLGFSPFEPPPSRIAKLRYCIARAKWRVDSRLYAWSKPCIVFTLRLSKDDCELLEKAFADGKLPPGVLEVKRL